MSQAGLIDIESSHPQIPTQFDTDGNPATPIANVLEVLGSTVAKGTNARPLFTKGSGNTVTLEIQVGKTSTGAPVDKNDAGIVSFDDASFSVNSDGYVTLVGGGMAIDEVNVDENTAPGTDPVAPSVTGAITVTGAQVATGTIGANVIRTNSLAVNTYTIEIQRTTTAAATNSTLNGVSHFDSAHFSDDGSGFISLGADSFTTGSVIFWGANSFAEDNSNFFWDDTNNRLGIGTTTPIHDLEVQGHVGIIETSTGPDAHVLEIIATASGFGDFKAVDINYITGSLSAGDEDAIILINIDETSATGGEIFGLEVLSTTEGTDVVGGLKVGIGVNAIHQESGTFGDLDEILNIAVDVTAALAHGGAGNISMFVADDDIIILGDAAVWDETEVVLDTGASGGGIAPIFAFSTGGANFTNFVPVDGTNGFKNTGVIDWDSSDLSGWATATSGRFEIRITRTRNTLTTTPIVDEIQRGAATEFEWDKNGDVNLNSLTLVVPLVVSSGGTGLATITDHGVMLGSGTGAVTPLGVAGNGVLVIGSAGADPVLGSLLSADASVTITPGAGSIDLAVAGDGLTNDTNALGTHNLGLFFSAGTATIKGADNNDLSATNPGYVTLRSNVTEGLLITYTMTGNFTFDDAAGTSVFAGSLFGMTASDTTTGDAWTPFYIHAGADNADANLSFFCSRYPGRTTVQQTGATLSDAAAGNADTYRDTLSLAVLGGNLTDYTSSNATSIGSFAALIDGSDDWTIVSLSNYSGIGRYMAARNMILDRGIMGQAATSYFLDNSGTAPTTASEQYQYRIDDDQFTLSILADITFSGSPASEVDAIFSLPVSGPNPEFLATLVGTLIVGGNYHKVVLRQVGVTVNTTARQMYLYKGDDTTARWQYDEFSSGDRLIISDSVKLR